MQAGLATVLEPRVYVDTLLQQELDDAGPAELTGPGESIFQLLLRCCRLWAAVVIEKGLTDVEPPASGRPFQIQAAPATRQKLGCRPATVMEAAINGAASIRTVDDGAMIDQQFHERQLHSRILGMPTRGGQSERCRASAVCVRFRVDVGAGVQQ